MKARCVAQQVAHRKRDDVFAGTPLLAAARTLLALASRNMKGTRCIGCFDTTAASVHSPMDELIVLIPPAGIVQPVQGLWLSRALYGTRKASRLWAKTLLKKALNSDGLTQSKAFPRTVFHAGQRACVTVTISVEASLEGEWGKVETALRNHFETKRLAVVGPAHDTPG